MLRRPSIVEGVAYFDNILVIDIQIELRIGRQISQVNHQSSVQPDKDTKQVIIISRG